MTKEITKAVILQEIQDKLHLRELDPERFAFSELVVPTYNIEQHLLHPEVQSATTTVVASGLAYFFSCPPTQKWHLHAYNVIFVTGSYKVAGVVITRQEPADYVYLDLTLNQTLSYAVNLPKDIVLFPGDDIRVNVDDYTSSGNLMVIIDVTVETIR